MNGGFRGADFPRLQILALGVIAFILLIVWNAEWDLAREMILIGSDCRLGVSIKNGFALYHCCGKNKLRKSSQDTVR